jgi:hypothetical protein
VTTKPIIQKAVAEFCDDGIMLMLPDGTIQLVDSTHPDRVVKALRRHDAAIAGQNVCVVTMLDWRNTPPGFEVPA